MTSGEFIATKEIEGHVMSWWLNQRVREKIRSLNNNNWAKHRRSETW